MVEKEMTRRRFLVLASGTVAAAVLAGCVRKEEIDSISDAITEAAPTAETVNSSAAAASANPAAASVNPTAAPASPTSTAAPVAQTNVRSACPRGLVNDPYPGKCKRYVDRNGNGICDLSEI